MEKKIICDYRMLIRISKNLRLNSVDNIDQRMSSEKKTQTHNEQIAFYASLSWWKSK